MNAFFRETLQQAWLSDNLLSRVLLPAAWVYGMLAGIRRWLFATGRRTVYRADVPVIVTGSVVVGGTGKTPVVIETVKQLQAMGWCVGVVSRGYGRTHTETLHVVRADSSPQQAGDEPLLIYRSTGAATVVCSDRARAVQQLCRTADVDVVVCDDGLQHWQLHRDAEILVFDDRGTGNGRLLPAGLLREQLTSRWRRFQTADCVSAAADGSCPDTLLLAPADTLKHLLLKLPDFSGESSRSRTWCAATVERELEAVARDADGRVFALKDLTAQGQAVAAVAGIARPTVFFDMLRAEGLHVAHSLAAADHADFSHQAYATLSTLDMPLLCTEKDAEKLRMAGIACFSVGLHVRLGAAHTDFLRTVMEKTGDRARRKQLED